ncbi:MAG TPA: hypothetical protein IAC98_04760 [Candidatus Cryptobacteroides pullicola]|nr:hypothetical protein [Candidatus Cryptobacteroides pullicola]
MKIRKFFLAVLPLAVLALGSCSKEGTRLFEGDYTYKLSGTIEVERVSVTNPGSAQDIMTLSIPDESGQMYILNKDDGMDRVLITMNAMLGSANTMEGTARDGVITLSPSQRCQRVIDNMESVRFDVEITGEGRKYDDVVIFELSYEGQAEGIQYNYRIVDSDIECIAREN